jgi:predicted RNA-binding Zn-ribbon protein involved in translation (DUF1610 family)
MKRMVHVRGDVEALWQTLLNTLTVHGYQIEQQNPYTQVQAKRGSKAISFFVGGTKDGYRELNVTLFPQVRDEFDVQFQFNFPSWTITLPGTKRECSDLIDEFVRLAQMAPKPAAPVTQAPKVQARCPSCNQPVRAGAKFCDNCGASLVLVCAKCGAQLPPGSKFCDSCGAPAE